MHVSCSNLGKSAADWLDDIPAELVHELHLAGHAVEELESGRLLIDDHGSAVGDEVFALYRDFIERVGARPTLIERDKNVPELGELIAEAMRAQRCLDRARNLDPMLGVRHG